MDNLEIGIFGDGNTKVDSCILARNFAADGTPNNASNIIDSLGYNITDSISTFPFNKPSDRRQTDPLVTRIGYHGGKVLTCYPLDGSPAIDGGNDSLSITVSRDARNFLREARTLSNPVANFIDVGAVEINQGNDLEVTNTNNSGAGSLRTAILNANNLAGPESSRIIFAPELAGQTITVASDLELVRHHIDIDASALASPVKIKAGDGIFTDIFRFNSGSSAFIRGLIFEDFDNQGLFLRAPIICDDASLGLSCCEFNRNSLQSIIVGGQGRVLVNECFFQDNTSDDGGAALLLQGACFAQIWNSTFNGNVTTGANESDGGGAIKSEGVGHVELWNATFDKNTAPGNGSAILIEEGSLNAYFTTFSANSAGNGTLAITGDTLTSIRDCLFVGNATTTAGTLTNDVLVGNDTFTYNVLRNWTTNNNTTDIFDTRGSNVRGATLSLAPLENHGGKVSTRPMFVGNLPLTSSASSFDRALDSHANPRFDDDFPAAGAVETGVVASATPYLSVLSIIQMGNSLEVSYEKSAGPVWEVQGSTSLTPSSFSGDDIGITLNAAQGGIGMITIPLPSPTPKQYFFRFARNE